jgi:hypothetical protein
LRFDRGEKESAFARAGQVGGLPAGAHDAGGGVGVGAEEEVAKFVGDGVTEDAREACTTNFVEVRGAVVEEVGVTADAVGGEVRDAHGELVQIQGVFGDSELKMEGEIGGFTLRRVYRAGGWEGAVQPADFEACVLENT